MKAWRESVKRPGSNPVSALAAAEPSAAAASPPSAAPANPQTATPAAAQPAANSAAPASEKAVLTTKILSLQGSLQEIQAQLEAQHNKLLSMQAQVRYAEQHPKVAVAPVAEHGSRSLLTAALAGVALLAGVCVALYMRLRRRAKSGALPSIEKVPVVAPVDAAHAPAAKPKPVPVVVRAPEAPRIEVHEHPSEARIDAGIGMFESYPEEQAEPMESALELSMNDTSGIDVAKLREELAAAKLREEIAAAWALPAAETYKREDLDHESTLVQDIANSLEDTVKLETAKAQSEEDTIDEEAYTDTIANPDIDTFVGAAGETAHFAATAILPASAILPEAAMNLQIDAEHLDYNLLDLDQSTEAVNSQADANDRLSDTQRRANLVEALKQAIEREPDRRDLRMKLLETYYAEAATNKQGFVEAMERLARERGDMDEAEWQKIEQMRRKLGADDPLLDSQQDEVLANLRLRA